MILALADFQDLFNFLVWKYIHIVNASIFFGLIFTSSIIEWYIYHEADMDFAQKYHVILESLDKKCITVSMTGLLISAIAMMNLQGYSLFEIQAWPWWMSSALINISVLGLVWALIDVQSQKKLAHIFVKASSRRMPIVKGSNHGEDLVLDSSATQEKRLAAFRKLYKFRMWLNIFSNAWIIYIFYLMVFKPN
ncbi:MAG: hypothetical protein CL916_08355 [Deltaproteobacteria bacterium]|nr:hypothetical protein [Deltaproteobacteria bacterium]